MKSTKAIKSNIVGFNYSGIPPAIAKSLKENADEIKRLRTGAMSAMLRIGALLGGARQTLRPPVFRAWLAAEFSMKYSTARHWIAAAEKFPNLPEGVASKFDSTALMMLSYRTVPSAARDAAVKLARNGVPISATSAMVIRDAHRADGDPSRLDQCQVNRFRSSLRAVVRNWTGERQSWRLRHWPSASRWPARI